MLDLLLELLIKGYRPEFAIHYISILSPATTTCPPKDLTLKLIIAVKSSNYSFICINVDDPTKKEDFVHNCPSEVFISI